MATTFYALIEILLRRGYPEAAADPLLKWTNKRLVETLIQSDLAHGGGTSGPSPMQEQRSENNDDGSAVEDFITKRGLRKTSTNMVTGQRTKAHRC